ncbi:PD-(D/E)XK nuclease family protein [Candidatus Enterococcus clewellii]|uniref:ATP-dependent helicase/deoxyribonuclease subunit B n=1 Tax=Candidatus Enterococcus clewellii TaxID=1834193 RepID=A0A242KCV7_9ENTE|nr:PD-(D/E)XK nuclease family protein [Enterococcus sp. 9E7_DIV0242]OTP19004.1 helicase-exonuclease AddAB, AddB subunit [Enterococcus sp. 9E7_DIV0242]
MSLQFIRGTGEKNLEKILVDKASEWLDADSNNEVFYLVPNNIKFEKEVLFLKEIKKKMTVTDNMMATMRLQVFSFQRLAWYFLQHTHYYQQDQLSEVGAAMIFRKILSENEERLTVFRGEINKSGFIQQLYALYQEMKEGNVELSDLAAIATDDQSPDDQDMARKLEDIQWLFAAFEGELQRHGINETEYLTVLSSYLKTKDLGNVLFVLSGYNRFNAKEQLLLQTLMEQGAEVKIALTLDHPYPDRKPEGVDLFFETGSTYFQLYQLARQSQVAVLNDHVEKSHPLIQSKEITQLGDFWLQTRKHFYKNGPSLAEAEDIQLWCAETPKEELASIAKEIRRLVVEEGYRYKDIQIATRDFDSYQPILKPIFKLHDIPIYIDQDMSMEQHPLVELIHSLFAIDNYHFRYRDVLRFLRTELFLPGAIYSDEMDWRAERDDWRRKIDITENIILAYGYEGSHWTREKDWTFIRYDFEEEKQDETTVLERESNEVRHAVRDILPALFSALKEAGNGEEAAAIFYRFLISSGVEEQMRMWRNQAIAAGELEEARNHEQTWDALMALLDEYVMIYKDEVFEFDSFQEIFSSGLEGLRYSKIPTAIDQVQIRPIDTLQSGQAKITFALGLTDQVFPKKVENKTLLSDEERSRMNDGLSEGKFFLQGVGQRMAQEPYTAYIMLLSASEKLYLTYPRMSDTAHDVKPSSYLSILRKNLKLSFIFKNSLSIADDEQTSLQHVGTYRTLIGDLTNLKRQRNETQQGLSGFWHMLERSLSNQPLAPLAAQIFESLNHKNIPESLGPELAEEVYGKHIYTSVSRVESFYRCQYQYFSRFGLRLRERDVFGLSSAATGEFFHEALDQLFKVLIKNNQQLSELTDAQLNEVAEEVLINVLGDQRFGILDSSHRMNFIRYQLRQTIKKVSWALKQQSERSGLSTVQTEVLFGQIAGKKGIRGLELPLQNNGQISVRGKIDRVDQLSIDGETYLGVIDYKSSHRKFNLTEAYYGLAMQMLTYLDVALMDAVDLVGQEAKAAGSLYLHVHNPILGFDGEEQQEKQLLKKFQFDGLLLNDPKILEHLDRSLEPKQSSLVFPIEESAKEIIKPGRRQDDKFVTIEEFDTLRRHNRNKFTEAGNKMISGEVNLDPAYQGKERIACKYCPFRSVCTFDVMLKENDYHRIESMGKQEIFDRMRNEEDEGESENE